MGLDITFYKDIDVGTDQPYYVEFYSSGMTHNMNRLADALNIYDVLWHDPEKLYESPSKIKPKLIQAIDRLESNPSAFVSYNAVNGWGTVTDFLSWLKDLLKACDQYPAVNVHRCR